MDRSHTVDLIARRYEPDALGQSLPVETVRTVFCRVESISRAEWYDAGRSGRKPQYKLTLLRYDYADEPVAALNGVRYSVYRTYLGKGETMELYLEEKAGV